MKKSKLFIIIGVIGFFSCSEKNIKNVDNHPLLKVGSVTNTSVYEIFESVELISLETSEMSLINKYYKVDFYDNKYFIFDIAQYALVVFDNTGKYLYKIHRIGQGPEEYTMVYDCLLDKKQNTIEMLDPNGRVIIYDLQGNYLESKRLPNPPVGYRHIQSLNDSTYIFYSYSPHGVSPINSVSKHSINTQPNVFLHDPVISSFGLTFHKFNDKIFLTEYISDNVYKISETNYEIAYEWDFGHKMNDFSSKIKSTRENQNEILSEYVDRFDSDAKNFFRFGDFQTKKYYYTLVDVSKIGKGKHSVENLDLYNVFYNKESKKVDYFKYTKEELQFSIWYMDDKCSIGILNPDCIEGVLNSNALKEENIEILKSHLEDDNPIVIKLNFK